MVSRSGEIESPHTSVSSPVFPMTVRSCGNTHVARPRRSLAAPGPPARATRRMSVAEVFAERPQRGPATPCVETAARPPGQLGWQRALGDRNEAEADPDPVEALRAREQCHDPGGRGVIEHGGDELRGDFERVGVDADDGTMQEHGWTAPLSDHCADQALSAVRRTP